VGLVNGDRHKGDSTSQQFPTGLRALLMAEIHRGITPREDYRSRHHITNLHSSRHGSHGESRLLSTPAHPSVRHWCLTMGVDEVPR